LISKSHNTNDDEKQSLDTQAKKRKEMGECSSKKSKRPHYKNDASNIICYNYKDMVHYDAQCPLRHEKAKKKHHAHAIDVEEKKSKDEDYLF